MKQKNFKLVWLIIAVMVLAFVPKDAEAEDAVDYTIDTSDKPEGGGTKENPYLIENRNHLYWFAALVNGRLGGYDPDQQSACAKLTADITVNEDLLTKINTDDGTIKDEVTDDVYRWTPIGTDKKPFLGTFDGKGHTIEGLYINASSSFQGLFGCCGIKENDIIYPGTIKNVGVIDSYIKGAYYIGGVCGTIDYGTIENCYNTGIVSATENYTYVGGICGFVYDESCTISNCYNTGDVSATGNYASVGGVCGASWGTIENCYNTGDVSATGNYADVGGVCGNNASGGIIQYKRANLAVGNYGTICMPYAVAAGKIVGAEFYSIAGKEEKDGTVTSVYLEKVKGDLVAGQPYIFKATAETLTCTITSTSGEAEKAGKHNGLIGCFEETEVPEGDNIYVLKNNKLYKRGTQDWKIAAGRAYIDLSPITAPSSAPTKGVIKIGVSGDGTTGIGAVTAEHDNVYYNLQGQRVAAPSRGIYIVNGKKVIIK